MMMVIGGRDITSILSEYFNPSHLGARNDVFSPDLNLTQLETPLQGRLNQLHGSCWFWLLSSDQTSCSPWSLLVPGPILRSDFLQSLVPAGFGSYPQIRSLQSSDLPVPGPNPKLISTIIDSCWFWIFTTQQVSTTFRPNGGSHHQASPRRHPYYQTHNSASYGKDARFSSGTQHFTPGFTTWTNSKDRRREESVEELLEIPQAYQATTKSTYQIPLELFRERIPAKRREHCFSTSCNGAEEKCELYIRTCWPSDSWVQLEQMRVKDKATGHLVTSKKRFEWLTQEGAESNQKKLLNDIDKKRISTDPHVPEH
ncbi:hypothetical protein DY000_02022241 [Brassica cretica]|uniref:Uncharacterized protein n=1 Tax=Brassica cretica TaxID=69181 RepID=A0ABQ7E4H6_BRACR|nr:hypothetical protein DY000_02022241 [Brassica cretica]